MAPVVVVAAAAAAAAAAAVGVSVLLGLNFVSLGLLLQPKLARQERALNLVPRNIFLKKLF